MNDMESKTPKPRTGRSTISIIYSMWSSMITLVAVAAISATLFTLWTPANLFSGQLLDDMLLSLQAGQLQPEIAPTQSHSDKPRIGIVAGHKGNDSGAVCPDGLTEQSVNEKIAILVRQYLLKEGFEVDLLDEYDTRLTRYKALALVSIHNDSCDFISNDMTGFKVAAAPGNAYPEKADRLTACLVQRYSAITGLPYHSNTVTADMTDYHGFSELDQSTTAAIIETGFLNLDREILTKDSGKVAYGVTAGILCYIRNEPISAKNPTPVP